MSDETTRRQITLGERDLLVDFNRKQALEALLGTEGISRDMTVEQLTTSIKGEQWDAAAECMKRAADLAKDQKQATLKTAAKPAAKGAKGSK